jgi:hypothetical protein
MAAPIYKGGLEFLKKGFRSTNYVFRGRSMTGIVDNVATSLWKVSVPIPAVSCNATFIVRVCAVIGAGGAVGAGESSSGSLYVMNASRQVNGTTGEVTVISTGSQLGVASGVVSGGDTFTATIAASSVTGAAGVAQSFNIQVTAHDSSGSGAAHTGYFIVEMINAGGTFMTIADA